MSQQNLLATENEENEGSEAKVPIKVRCEIKEKCLTVGCSH